jgi:thiamine biosynthesis lipoprotein
VPSLHSSATISEADGGDGRRSSEFRIERRPYGWCGHFRAMANPCEVHVSGAGRGKSEGIVGLVHDEAIRIERKFSRYLQGNIVDRINHADGAAVSVDDETARLLDYAAELHRLSEGRFDITSGVLRRAWSFDEDAAVPSAAAIEEIRSKVGWDKVEWRDSRLCMPAGMEIDFGGIGKEYAVDRAATLVRNEGVTCMINFGGDLIAQGVPELRGRKSSGWMVGIESLTGTHASKMISLASGAIATSGDTRRFVEHDGKRFGHILDARSGWPVVDAPRSVTVVAPSCTQAGMLATFAMLMGKGAEAFLISQNVRHWCLR